MGREENVMAGKFAGPDTPAIEYLPATHWVHVDADVAPARQRVVWDIGPEHM